MTNRVEVTISCGTLVEKKYELEYGSFEELKTRILKRFGNISGTNRGVKEKGLVKDLIRGAISMEEITELVSVTTWSITFRHR